MRFLAYTPREFSVVQGRAAPASPAGIAEDLARLRSRFDGLITYSTYNGHEAIPALARSAGYRALILGVWDPADPAEVTAAIAAANRYPELVLAICLGNEGIYTRRYSATTLMDAIARVRRAIPDAVLVTTAEPYVTYLRDDLPGFLSTQDFLLPTIHPVYEPWFRKDHLAAGVDFLERAVTTLQARAARPVLVKETGVPSGPAVQGWSEALQAAFWQFVMEHLPSRSDRSVAFFEAFDLPWKPAIAEELFGGVHPEEAHWGFNRSDGTPKPVNALLPLLQ